MHHAPADKRRHRTDVLDLVGGHGEVVAVEHHEIGEQARPDGAEVVLLEHQQRVAAGGRDQGLFARQGLPLDELAVQGPARDRPPQRDERVDLGRLGAVGAQAEGDAAVLNRPQRRHVVTGVAERLEHRPTVDHHHIGAQYEIHAQLSDPLQLVCRDVVRMGDGPAQWPHGLDGVDLGDEIQDAVDGFGLGGVGLHRPAAPGGGDEDLAGPADVVRARFGGPQRAVPVKRRIPDLPDGHQIHERVPLKGPGALDLRDQRPCVLRCSWHAAAQGVKDAYRQPSVGGDLAQPRVALSADPDAGGIIDRRQPDAVEVAVGGDDGLHLLVARDGGEALQRQLDHGEAAI